MVAVAGMVAVVLVEVERVLHLQGRLPRLQGLGDSAHQRRQRLQRAAHNNNERGGGERIEE